MFLDAFTVGFGFVLGVLSAAGLWAGLTFLIITMFKEE